MATRPYVPRTDGESSIGVKGKKWGKIFAYEIDEKTNLGNNQSLGYRQPSTTQRVGDIRYHATLPAGWYLECTTEGNTGSGEITIKSPTVGGTVSDGTVTWTIRKNASTQDLTGYLPLSGGAMTGSDITRNIDSSALSIRGGSDVSRGGAVELFGKDYDIASLTGAFRLVASDSIDIRYIEGHPDGRLIWNGNSLDKSAVVAESLGVNGYRKYASGLIEQWGYTGSATNVEGIGDCMNVVFPISFSTNPQVVVSARNDAIQLGTNKGFGVTIITDTLNTQGVKVKKFNITTGAADVSGSIMWRAIGY